MSTRIFASNQRLARGFHILSGGRAVPVRNCVELSRREFLLKSGAAPLAPGWAAGTGLLLAAASSPQTNRIVSAGICVALEHATKHATGHARQDTHPLVLSLVLSPARLPGHTVDQCIRMVSEFAARQDIGSALATPRRRACPGGRALRDIAHTSIRNARWSRFASSVHDIRSSVRGINSVDRATAIRPVAYQMRTVLLRNRAQSCNTHW